MATRMRSSPGIMLRSGDQTGFSVIELLIVVAIIAVMIAATIISLAANRRAYRTEDAAAQVVNFMRDASQRALAQRQTMRVTLDRSTNQITLVDENILVAGDEDEVRRGNLIDRSEILMDQPMIGGNLVNSPNAPYAYSAAFKNGVDSGQWVARFQSDGSVVDSAGEPMSATLFFAPANVDESSSDLIRAVTVFGPSGSVRYWRYDRGNQRFTAEVR